MNPADPSLWRIQAIGSPNVEILVNGKVVSRAFNLWGPAVAEHIQPLNATDTVSFEGAYTHASIKLEQTPTTTEETTR